MDSSGKKKVVLLGMMSRMPVGGNIWLVLQYLIGLKRLGYDPYYVEAHGWTPSRLMETPSDDGWRRAAHLIGSILSRVDMQDRWAYHAIDRGEQVYGMTKGRLRAVYRNAAAIINLHGATELLAEHLQCPVRIYLETDPVDVEVHVYNGVEKHKNMLAAHSDFFTWGTNYGRPGCQVPIPPGIRFHPTFPPVILDFWNHSHRSHGCYTTIGNWKDTTRNSLRFEGDVYHWSKHLEFLKFVDLPRRAYRPFELAISRSSYNAADRQALESHGWRIRDALTFSMHPDHYRSYIQHSHGEFTVAKDQNIRLRSGWFSERSAQYLASGRPVITQETGFSSSLPTGEGLYAFSSMDDIVAAVDHIDSDYEQCRRRAREIAGDYFRDDIVLGQMLEVAGV